jgi:DNA-binding GntR family transcriptional regulator
MGALDRASASSQMPLTRAHAVADQLRRMIVSGELPGGTRLRQIEIAERFGVSTTPVREAFTVLAREGIVQQDTHRGVIVFAPSFDDVRETYEIRAALESLAAELAAKRITAQELDELDALLAEMKVSIREDIGRHTTVHNPRFHQIINRAARRPRLLEMIATMRQAALTYQTLLVTPDLPDSYLDAVNAEHDEIAAALRARAPKRAARAIRAHIDHNLKMVLSSLPEQGERTDVA